MRFLHTSDWHLGKTLYGRRCHKEFKSFLDWLLQQVQDQCVECLLIAGDIFDTTTPANSTLSLYYSFLHSISTTNCRHVVIIAGNHDSPSLLNAPRKLLKHLNITVVGSSSGNPAEEVIPLKNAEGETEAIICAVPFLRDRDVRKVEPGESIEDKTTKLHQGIHDHYAAVIDLALKMQDEIRHKVPLIAMGHLFTTGGKVENNNEIRDLYVGSLAHVQPSTFPQCIDYLALGHLHIAQTVNRCEKWRYSGSPLQLSFGRKTDKKVVVLINLDEKTAIREIEIPRFLDLQTVRGDFNQILTQINRLVLSDEKILVEIIHTGHVKPTLQDELYEKVAGSSIEILRIMNQQILGETSEENNISKTLDDLNELEVFRRCMDQHNLNAEERNEMEICFSEILEDIRYEGEE